MKGELISRSLQYESSHIRESKTVLDSGFWIPHSVFRIQGLCQWNLDSGFQSLIGFRIP